MHKQQPVRPSAYQESLDAGTEPPTLTTSSVRYWSDFSRVYFHPKSLVQLYDFELDSTIRPFERFEMGKELFASLDKEHDILDRDWRPFVEESDMMQGMQVFTTFDDAWGGFASSYLEALRDEYPKSCIWVWGMQSPVVDVPQAKRQLRLSSIAQSFHQVYAQASMVVPLALPESQPLPEIELDPNSSWHVSSLLTTVAESALAPARLKGSSGGSLSDLAQSLNTNGGQTFAKASMSLPANGSDITGAEDSMDFLQIGRDGGKIKHRRQRIFGQTTCYRGPLSDTQESKEAATAPPRQIIGSPVTRKYVHLDTCLLACSKLIPHIATSQSYNFPCWIATHIYTAI